MQIPTTQAKTARIHFAETGTKYLQPIFVPFPTKQAETIQLGRQPYMGIVVSTTPIQAMSFDAEWLNIVEQRIIASIPAEGYSANGDTAWLQPDVGRAALDFFKRTSTVLPSEPSIYSSNAGDLVAEFATPGGRMTCLVSPGFVLVFASTKDGVIEKKFLPDQQHSDTFRSEIQEVTKALNA
jgi:hypothetical protein